MNDKPLPSATEKTEKPDEPELKTYVLTCFIKGFRGHPHGLEPRGDLDIPKLALALLDLASRPNPEGGVVTLRTVVREFVDPNISGDGKFIAKWEVAELVKELFINENEEKKKKYVGLLATLRENKKLGYSDEDIDAICKESARIDRADSEQLCELFGCWPPKRR